MAFVCLFVFILLWLNIGNGVSVVVFGGLNYTYRNNCKGIDKASKVKGGGSRRTLCVPSSTLYKFIFF